MVGFWKKHTYSLQPVKIGIYSLICCKFFNALKMEIINFGSLGDYFVFPVDLGQQVINIKTVLLCKRYVQILSSRQAQLILSS